MRDGNDPLLTVRDLRVTYPGRHGRGEVCAVNGVSLQVGRREVVGLVGESGCGKTTLGSAVMGLVAPAGGAITFDGEPVNMADRGWMRRYRRRVQMVFQDPMGALNPRLTVQAAIEETLYVYRALPGLETAGQRRARCAELLGQVGLDPSTGSRYPHELSGGQRQRIGIARALAAGPELLVADEPVSALDVSVQVQILNLLKDIRDQLGIACLFIAHDLAVVRYMCERVYVMVQGKVVESGDSDTVFESPSHPYTRRLIDAVPDVDRGLRRRKGQEPRKDNP
ncbi:MAG TPA: peptide ABC transporter ATP-binding protein [Verrucomicrobia bacterium]|nr:peptide ABC transporter ATP-binding protein [Verrucomicrobiota bacterium]